MKNFEIGSEFWDIPICNEKNKIFSESTKWFLSGRMALRYIIQDVNIKTVALPCWCCESMIIPFTEVGISVSFYNNRPNTSADAILVMDYFGYTGHNSVPEGYRGVVIRDVTHSIFSKTFSDADYYFGSLRKWAGFWTGGFAWGNWKKNADITPCDEYYVSLRRIAMNKKKDYLEGRSCNKDYIILFKEAENLLDSTGICGAHPLDVESAEHFDWQYVKRIRRENAKILSNEFNSIYRLGEDDCPLFVPILTENRDCIRRYLIDHKIYCPVHWPKYDWNGQELSLICDQRYGISDMYRIVDQLKQGGNYANGIYNRSI